MTKTRDDKLTFVSSDVALIMIILTNEKKLAKTYKKKLKAILYS
ncbi:hypothetical protein P615_13950 [Brevibacillus laterosporus PE36]|nr:hypothetical protein P615_13950 [Brevibacillus laterosporus PE36]